MRYFVPCPLLLLAACAATGSSDLPTMEPFGTAADGREVHAFTLTNRNGMRAKLTNLGATLVELHVPDREGNSADVVLGFDDASGYLSDRNQYFGCIAGRVANRIAGGAFFLDGTDYRLPTNDGGVNHLHGGDVGFGRRVWEPTRIAKDGEQGVRFQYVSPAGEEGYPGTLTATVTYRLTDDDELVLEYHATTDAPTPVNLTHHSYFDLAGHGAPTILDHELVIDAEHYTPTDETLIPTGEIAPVAGTSLDFRSPRRIGARIDRLEDTPAGGYDHNYVLDGEAGELRRAARLAHPESGRVLEIWTTEPGLQFYSGNFLFGQEGKDGAVYPHRSGLCLEAQHFPDSINQPDFPETVLRPGEEYRQVTVHRFAVER